jgi:hypothetical protein
MLNALLVIAALLIVGLDGLGTRYTGHHRRMDTRKKLTLHIPTPAECLYAYEMVDKPYTRLGITEDAQSHIVPTLLRQQQ